MNPFLNEHQIKSVVDRVYAFEGAVHAYAHMTKGAFGKIVIKIAD